MRYSRVRNFIKSMAIASAVVLGSTSAYASQLPTGESSVGAELSDDRTWNFTVGKNRDLFSNLKNLMPGDTIENTVVITNNSSRAVTFYFRVRPGADSTVQAGSEDAAAVEGKRYQAELLDIMGMKIWRGSDLLYEGNASGSQTEEDGGMFLSLGQVESRGGVSLRIEVKLPGEEMTNEYADSFGRIEWQFIAEGTDGGTVDNGGGDSNTGNTGTGTGPGPGGAGSMTPDGGPGTGGDNISPNAPADNIQADGQTPAGGNQAALPAGAQGGAVPADYQGGGVLVENVPVEELFQEGDVIGDPDDMQIIVEDEPVPLAAFSNVTEQGIGLHHYDLYLLLAILGILLHFLRKYGKRREYRKY